MWPGGAEAKHKGRDTPKDTPPDPNTETLTSSLDDLVASLREQMAADPNTEALTAALAAKDQTIELLKQQLEAQTRANDENHRIIGALTERLALPSPETREDAAYDVKTADRAERRYGGRLGGAHGRTSSLVVTVVAGVVAVGWQLVSVLCSANSARAQITHNSRGSPTVASRNCLLRFLATEETTVGTIVPKPPRIPAPIRRNGDLPVDLATVNFREFLFHALRCIRVGCAMGGRLGSG
jgi:hypothetical protein